VPGRRLVAVRPHEGYAEANRTVSVGAVGKKSKSEAHLLADLTYDALQREVSKQILRATFLHGQGAPLAFLWAVGAGLFTVTWGLPQYALLWSAASLGFAGLMGRDSLRNSRNWATASRQLLDARFTTDRISENRHREAVRKGIDLFHEVLLKLAEMKRNGALDDDLMDVVSEMDRLLNLQCESARQVEELERILSLVGIDQKLATGAIHLREENVAAIRHEILESETVIDLIGERLETLLLQVYRVETGASDVVARAEARRRSAEALDRIQQVVDGRRDAARQLIELLAPDWGDESDASRAMEQPGMPSRIPASAEATQPALVPERPSEPATSGALEPAARANGAAGTGVEELVPLVEEALRKLNNPGALASCRLLEMLPRTLATTRAGTSNTRPGQPTPLEAARTLREVLVSAIERMRPGGAAEPGHGAPRPDAAQHAILHEEYVQGMSTKAIMVRHSISESTFHRYRREATLILARELVGQERLLSHEANGHHPPLAPISKN
jgi:hypothetical protein